MRKAHNRGHFSVAKTKNLIENEYFIKKLEEKIQTCIKCCIPCLLNNRKRGKQEGELHPIPKKDVPLHTYHIHHLGTLKATSKMYNHIFVVIDAFTKFCWLYPTKSTTSREVNARLELRSNTFGNPEVIISDRGTAFTSVEFRQYCDNEGIAHHLITTGLPRANGQVERLNRVIIGVLSKINCQAPTKWYQHVPKVQQIINSTHHRSTNATSFEIMIEKKMNCKYDVKIKDLVKKEIVASYDMMRQALRTKAKEQIMKIQEENRTYNMRRRPAKTYNIDGVVAIKRTQLGGGLRLKDKYLGPYVVKNVKDTYDVVKIGQSEGPTTTTTCAEYMKWWPDTDPDLSGRKAMQDGRNDGM